MKQLINRTGKRPLEFDGEMVVSVSGRVVAGKERNRWHELSVLKTNGGQWVVSVRYRTCWEGEEIYDDAAVLASPDEVATFLEEYIFPNLGAIGYPPSPAYQQRQSRLIAELEAHWKSLVSAALAKLPARERVK